MAKRDNHREYSPKNESYSPKRQRSENNRDKESTPFRREKSGFDKDSSFREQREPRRFDSDSRNSFSKKWEKDSDRSPKREYSTPSKRYSDDKSDKRSQEFSSFRKEKPYFEKESRFSDNKKERWSDSTDKKPYRSNDRNTERSYDKPEKKREFSDRSFIDKKRDSSERSFTKKNFRSEEPFEERERPLKKDRFENRAYKSEKPRRKTYDSSKKYQPNFNYEKTELISRRKIEKDDDGDMRLNKYIAHCGLCSRRKAAELIESGQIKVNGVVAQEIGQRVTEKDIIEYNGKSVAIEEKMAYVLLNKPRGYITSVTDDRGRKTVMELVDNRIEQRVYPVGRLDRETTGLLLLTNDGDLAQKLSHPSHLIKKIYAVKLNKPLTKAHKEEIFKGLELEDGLAMVDSLDWVDDRKKDEVFVEVHIGKNRIVRRIFEYLGYEVEKLDRTYYAGLTKKDLPRGRFRYLTEREVIMLKHFTNRKVKKPQQ